MHALEAKSRQTQNGGEVTGSHHPLPSIPSSSYSDSPAPLSLHVNTGIALVNSGSLYSAYLLRPLNPPGLLSLIPDLPYDLRQNT